jgi:hypothetical protein
LGIRHALAVLFPTSAAAPAFAARVQLAEVNKNPRRVHSMVLPQNVFIMSGRAPLRPEATARNYSGVTRPISVGAADLKLQVSIWSNPSRSGSQSFQ